MLIINSNIQSGSIDIPLDIAFDFEFDNDINPYSLNDPNVIVLYKMAGSEIAGTHLVTSSTPTSNTLQIIPTGDLEKNTSYTLIIKGNMNDSTLEEGVTDADGTEMEESEVYTFTTGESIIDPITEEPEEHTNPLYDDVSVVINEDDVNVNVLSVYPKESEIINNSLDKISILFDTEVESISDDAIRVFLSKTMYPFDEIPALEASYSLDYIASIDPENSNIVVFNLLDITELSFSDNIVISVEITTSKIVFVPELDEFGVATIKTLNDFNWYFVSNYTPLYAAVRQILSHPGAAFTARIPEGYIRQIIHEASVELDQIFDNKLPSNKYWVNRYIVCKTLQMLYNEVNGVDTIKSSGNIIAKSIGDLSIEYDTSSSDASDDGAYGTCIENALMHLITNDLSGSAVKSSETSSYPGRKRGI